MKREHSNRLLSWVLGLGGIVLIIILLNAGEARAWDNPSNIAIYLEDGESEHQYLLDYEDDTSYVNLSLVNYLPRDTQDRVLLICSETFVDVGMEDRWDLDFVNPVGGYDNAFYVDEHGQEYYKYMVAGDGTPTRVELAIDHRYLEPFNNHDQVRYSIRGVDYEAWLEPSNPTQREQFLEYVVDEGGWRNVSYLLEDGYVPEPDYEREVQLSMRVILTPPQPILFVDEYITALAGQSYNLSVMVRGHLPKDFIVVTAEMDHESAPYWDIVAENYILGSKIALDRDDTTTFFLRITPDINHSRVAGDRSYELKLRAESMQNPGGSHVLKVEVYVPIRYDPTITVSGSGSKPASVNGSTTAFRFMLANRGSIKDEIGITVELGERTRAGSTDDFWTKTIEPAGPFILPAGETLTIYVNLSPALDNEKIAAGLYPVLVNASSQRHPGLGSQALVTVEMPSLHLPDSILPVEVPSQENRGGLEQRGIFRVTNPWELENHFELDLEVVDDSGAVVANPAQSADWQFNLRNAFTAASLLERSFRLAPGESLDVEFAVTPPTGTPVGNYTLRFITKGTEPVRHEYSSSNTFTLLPPELFISPLDIAIGPASPMVGKKLVINATIHLNGSLAEPVQVKLILENEAGESYTAFRIANFSGAGEGSQDLCFEIPPTGSLLGVCTVTITLDTGDLFIEQREDNNQASAMFLIRDQPAEDLEGPDNSLSIVCSLVLLMLFLAFLSWPQAEK